jgi:hypothetical protein
MVKLISFVFQMILLKKSFSKTAAPFEHLERAAIKARGYFLFTIGCAISLVFLTLSLVVAIISVGLQIEKNGGISFSGLMISAAIFLAVSIFLFMISSILLVLQKQKMFDRLQSQVIEQATGSTITPLVEEILKQFLKNLTDKKAQKKKEPAAATSTTND